MMPSPYNRHIFLMIFGKRRDLAHVHPNAMIVGSLLFFCCFGSFGAAEWFRSAAMVWSGLDEVGIGWQLPLPGGFCSRPETRQVNSETFNTQFLPLARSSFANRSEGWPKDWAAGQNCAATAFVVARLRQLTSFLKLGDFGSTFSRRMHCEKSSM